MPRGRIRVSVALCFDVLICDTFLLKRQRNRIVPLAEKKDVVSIHAYPAPRVSHVTSINVETAPPSRPGPPKRYMIDGMSTGPSDAR